MPNENPTDPVEKDVVEPYIIEDGRPSQPPHASNARASSAIEDEAPVSEDGRTLAAAAKARKFAVDETSVAVRESIKILKPWAASEN